MFTQYTISGPDGLVSFTIDGDQYITAVWGQQVTAGGSPVVVTPSPPIGPVTSINLGTLYQQLVALVAA